MGRTQTRGSAPKQARREEGERRNTAWQALSKTDKINSLKGRRGESKRQMKRLEA